MSQGGRRGGRRGGERGVGRVVERREGGVRARWARMAAERRVAAVMRRWCRCVTIVDGGRAAGRERGGK